MTAPSRRSFLTSAGAAVGAFAGASLLPSWTASALAAPPGLPSMDEVWRWQHELVGFGTRYTGSPGHVQYTDWLQDKFAQVAGLRLHTDRLTFHRWLARDWSLPIEQDASLGKSGPVPVSYYYPYSGTTGPRGVAGRLVDLGTYTPAVPGTPGTGYTPEFWLPAKDAIALVRVPPSTFSLATGQTATGGYRRGRTSEQAAADFEQYAAVVTNPAFNGIFAAIPLLDAKNAGRARSGRRVDGDVGRPGAQPVQPVHHAVPEHSRSSRSRRSRLSRTVVRRQDRAGPREQRPRRQPDRDPEAHRIDHAERGHRDGLGVLPGSGTDHGDGLIVNTHTDGPNATEENGALGMLALAQYFARQPRRRDLYFAMVTGHFQLPQFIKSIPTPRPEVGSDATSAWMAEHPAIYQRALAGLTVEHLGCTMWTDDSSGRYAATGGYEWGTTYTAQKQGSTSPTNLEQQAYLAAVRAVNAHGHVDRPAVTVLPGAVPLYLGEGAPLYAGGLGTVSLVPLPSYLLQAGDRRNPRMLDLDKLDKRLAYGQILSFARTIKTLDRAPASAF